MRTLFLVATAFFALTGNAWAWGEEGHEVVCEIAMRFALPSTRAEIRRLMKGDQEYDFFRDSCIWPDHPKRRKTEHYINLPRDSRGLTKNACPGNVPCVLSAIQADFAVLSSDDATDDQKLTSLKFLGHWVGDIHQPLHVSFKDDIGGNDIAVIGACTGDLHSTWDTCLVQKAVGPDVVTAANDLLKSITPAKRETWTHAAPFEWANESFAISESAGTKYCVRQGGSCELPSPTDVEIDQAYLDENLRSSGNDCKWRVRLAHLLDAAFGKAAIGEKD